MKVLPVLIFFVTSLVHEGNIYGIYQRNPMFDVAGVQSLSCFVGLGNRSASDKQPVVFCPADVSR